MLFRGPIVIAWLAALPGCSMLFVDGPPPDHARRAYFDCTSSRLGPIADTILAVSFGASAAVAGSGNAGPAVDAPAEAAIMLLGMGVLSGASAVGGFGDTAECDEAIDELNRRRMTQPTTWLPGATPTPTQAGASGGCLTNQQCKVGRVCIHGTCMDYAPQPQPAPLAPPAPTTIPAPHEAPVLLFDAPPPSPAPMPPP